MEIPNDLPVIDLSPPKEEPKEPFCFSYTVPSLDWFDTKTVTIGPQDYYYFRLERRFGPSWWLIGSNPTDDDSGHYWTDTQLGELRDRDLYRFIKWAKSPWGSKIVEVKALSSEFNIIDDIITMEKAKGNMITLPCKITDTIYLIEGVYKGKKRVSEKIVPAKIDHFTIGDLGTPVIDACTESNVWYTALEPGDYYISVEDAQAAIEKEYAK